MCSSRMDGHYVVIHKRCSLSNFPYVIKFIWEFIVVLEGAQLFHINVVFNVNLEHIAILFPSLHIFQNYAFPVRLLNSKPFMKHQFHFFIIVKSVTHMLPHCPKVTF